MSVYWTITRNTFRELIRQPIYLVLMVSSSVFMLFLASLYYAGAEEDASMVHSGVLATLFLCGLLTSVVGASSSIGQEVDSGTALVVLSKPVGRMSFILAKFTGLAGALAVQCSVGGLSALLATRMAFDVYGKPDYPAIIIMASSILLAFVIGLVINFFARKPFVELTVYAQLGCIAIGFLIINCLSKDWKPQTFGTDIDFRMLNAILLILMALWLIAGIATACSTRLGLIPTLVICLCLFLCGLVSDHFLGSHAEAGIWSARIAYSLIPNWQLFWMADALALKASIPIHYLMYAFLYTSGSLGISLGLAIALFEDRELK